LLASASGAFSGAAAALLLAGLAGGLAYSLPPIAAMRRGWGEPLNALLGALLLPLFGVAVVVGSVGSSDVVAFLPFFLVVMASVMATAWPDRDADAATGKLTMQVRLGPRTLRLIHAAASATFVVATLISAAVGAMPLALAGLLVLPALVVGAARYTRVTSPLANVAAMVSLVAITTVALIIELNASGRLG
jgi:1,4-dihydroxy-2-naphthoate octaprenyltransferase